MGQQQQTTRMMGAVASLCGRCTRARTKVDPSDQDGRSHTPASGRSDSPVLVTSGNKTKRQLMTQGRDTLGFVMFVLVFTAWVNTSNLESTFWFSDAIKRVLQDTSMRYNYTGYSQKFYGDIINEADFWQYLEYPLFDRIYHPSNASMSGTVMQQNL